MAQQAAQLDRDIISCSICLDFLKDPVTVPCGHSYCEDCIDGFWDDEDWKQIYSCPQCRKTFEQRPVLLKSTMLADLVEQLKKTELQAAPADLCYAGPEDVACDYCTGWKLKAFKSCLVCLVSYCEKHLQPHYDVAPLKKHKLVDPSKKLQENICSQHDEVMKMFCRTDKQLICYLCSVDDHKGHDTVSAASERSAKQKELEASQQNIRQRIQDREKDVMMLPQALEAINDAADEAVKDSEETFTEMIHLIEERSSEVKQKIRSQQEAEVGRVKEFQEKLEKEITDLKKKEAELEQLLHTEDHNQFLQDYPSLSSLSDHTHSSSINIRPMKYFQDVTAAVSEIRDKVQDVLRDTWAQPEPITREDFIRYSREITLDPNTAHEKLFLSDGNRKAEVTSDKQFHVDHSERFTFAYQVLSKDSLTGRCYWEVEKGEGGLLVVVSYKNNDTENKFGQNDTSWALGVYKKRYDFRHNSIQTPISGPRSSRVGVYLDHSAGVLSFYSISEIMETMTPLHTVQTTFTQPLYAGFLLHGPEGSTAEICNLE